MKTLKIVLYTILTVAIVYGAALLATLITVTSMGGQATGATINAYQTTVGNLIISQPANVDTLEQGDVILTAGTQTTVGTFLNATPVSDYYLVQVQTGQTEAEINNYTASETIQKVVTQIPVIGLIPGLLQKNVAVSFVLLGFIIGVSLILVRTFYQKRPVPQPVTEDNIGYLEDIFDAAPNRMPTKKDIKIYERTVKNAR